MRQRGGRSGWDAFDPKAGDTGTIVNIFYNKGASHPYIYLLKIGQYYVPIGCGYVTDIDKPDMDQQAQQDWINDSIANVNYAAGCKFKINNVNEHWNRAGLTNLDKESEVFACELTAKGIDTIMLCKHIFDNGSLPIEKAFILWLDNGKGYVKAFFNNSKHQPTNNKIQPFESKELIDHFFTNRIDTVTSEPQTDVTISHSLGYSIQLYTPHIFYRERVTDFAIRQNKTHPKSIWWNMITEKLVPLKAETP